VVWAEGTAVAKAEPARSGTADSSLLARIPVVHLPGRAKPTTSSEVTAERFCLKTYLEVDATSGTRHSCCGRSG